LILRKDGVRRRPGPLKRREPLPISETSSLFRRSEHRMKLAIFLMQVLQQAFRDAFRAPEWRPARVVVRRHH
jgi:hypothetical protein